MGSSGAPATSEAEVEEDPSRIRRGSCGKEDDDGDKVLRDPVEHEEGTPTKEGSSRSSSGGTRGRIISDESDEENEDPLPKTVMDKSQKGEKARKSKVLSDSEEEDVSKTRKMDISDHSDEDDELLDIPPTGHGTQSSVIPGRVLDPDIYGDDGDSSDDSKPGKKHQRNTNKYPGSSSEDDERVSSHVASQKGEKSQMAEKYKKKTQRKASEKARAKTLQEIASETQKLVREKRIELPYHKPKQLTLDEFLKRRTQAKSRVFSTIAQQPSTLGTMLNTLVKMDEDILPALARAEVEKAESPMDEGQVEVIDCDDKYDDEMQDRPSVTGEDQPSFEKVGGWLDNHTIAHEDPTGTVVECCNEESISAEIVPTVQEEIEEKRDVAPDVDAKGQEVSPGQDVIHKEETKMQNQNQSIVEGEAELASFLEEMKPKPKRKTLAERLKAMPGYEKLASAKPRIGGGRAPPTGIIDLGDVKKSSKYGSKKDKAIQSLMDRFIKHAGVGESIPKEQHHKVHVNTLEKDSQGLVQDMKTDQFDYVTKPVEEDNILDIICKPKVGSSPGGRGREAVPGEKMVRLRVALKERIQQKKAKQYEERLQEAEAQKKVDEENESDEEIIEDEDVDISDSEEEEELLEDDMPKQRKKKTQSAFVDEEAEDDGDIEDEDSSAESDVEDVDVDDSEVVNEENDSGKLDTSKKKLIRQIVYSDDEDENLSTVLTERKLAGETNSLENSEILASEKNCISEEDNGAIAGLVQSTGLRNILMSTDDDLPDLCSGRFPSQAPLTPVESQNDCFGFDVDDDDENAIGRTEVSDNIGGSEDDEDDSESLFCAVSSKPLVEDTEEKIQRLNKDLIRKEEDEDEEEETAEDDRSVGELSEEMIEDELDLDDDDNEEVALEKELMARRSLEQSETPKRKSTGLFGKGGRLRRKFFEEEAEFSGSEEGSADEDERGLNYYEDEDGDADELDEAAVKNQVERAHLKQMLDQDDREIRYLQEEYLERGDLEDGKLRVRKFRWTDIDQAWGDDAAVMGDSDGEEGEATETEEERKKRYEEIEKRKWLLEHPDVMQECAEESQKQLLQGTTKFLKLGTRTQKKIESFLEHSSSIVFNETSNSVPDSSFATLVKSQIKASAKMMLLQGENKQSAFPAFEKSDTSLPSATLNQSSSQPLFSKFASPDELTSKIKRGSFLSRDSPSLSRLAEITKHNDPGHGASNIKSNSRNFVFSVITPPDQQSKQKVPKRPATSNSQGSFLTKKIKVDRSFSSLDESSKDASIFKYM